MARLIAGLILSLVCLAGQPAGAAKIAVIISADVDPYQEALRGFKNTVEHEVVAEYDMRGDFERGRRIVQQIRTEAKPDLVLAMGVWALQLVVREKLDLPIVFAMVLNPSSVLGSEAENITGASMNVPVDRPIALLEQLGPQVRRIGVVFNPAKTGYLVETARAVAEARGLELKALAIDSSKEAIKAVDSLYAAGIDALWILPDETVLEPKVIEYALLTSYRNKVPLLGLSERQAEMGAMLSMAFSSSEDIGRQAGELSNEILGGQPTGRLPYTTARSVKLVVNLKAAQKLGMQIPESILAMADSVIR